jgi:serine protease Do
LQIEAAGLHPAEIGDAADLGVGSFVAAIGNSYGFACGLAWGEVNGFRPDGTIQLSLGVSAGSSGGALVDTRGRVVGLIKAKISEPYYLEVPNLTTGGATSFTPRRIELPTSSLSLAIPIGTALRLARNVSETGAGAPAYVGVYVDDLTGWQVEHFKTNQGVLVVGVVEGSPAARYGLSEGDIIRSVGSQPIESVRRFRQVIVQSRPGERMAFDIVRDGRPLRVTLEMARADLPDLNASIDPTPMSAARALPIVPVSSSQLGASSPLHRETREYSAPPQSETSVSTRDMEARLRSLERTVDSLMREIQTQRQSRTP